MKSLDVDLVIVASLIVMGVGIAGYGIVSCVQKPKEPETLAPVEVSQNWQDKTHRSLELIVVCVDGFEYYMADVTGQHVSRAVMSPKFDRDTALPKRCNAEVPDRHD
jgi:hypothetical protein